MEISAAAPGVAQIRESASVDLTATALPFERFYEEHGHSVYRALAATLNDPELAADATNEAMSRAFQRWSKIGSYDEPSAWVYRVGLNWSLSWKQRRRRERERPVRFAAETTELAVRDRSLDGPLASLSLEHRSVVVCRVHLDWSVEQTATALGIKPGTVKSRLARALDKLRMQIEDETGATGHAG